MPKIAGLVAASFLFAAYSSSGVDEAGGGGGNNTTTTRQRTGYVVSAVLAVAIVPYTLLTMRGTNNLLLLAAEGSVQAGVDVAGLVERWAALNLGRSCLPLASAVVGMLSYAGALGR